MQRALTSLIEHKQKRWRNNFRKYITLIYNNIYFYIFFIVTKEHYDIYQEMYKDNKCP